MSCVKMTYNCKYNADAEEELAYRFASSSRKRESKTLMTPFEVREHRLDRFLLVGSQAYGFLTYSRRQALDDAGQSPHS